MVNWTDVEVQSRLISRCVYVQVICNVKPKISGRRWKRDFTVTDRYGSGFRDWKWLRRWGEPLFSHLVLVCFPASGSGCVRNRFQWGVGMGDCVLVLSVICKRQRLKSVKKFCVDDEEDRAQHSALWDTFGRPRDTGNTWSLTMTGCVLLSDKKKIRRMQYKRCRTGDGVCWKLWCGQLCWRQPRNIIKLLWELVGLVINVMH